MRPTRQCPARGAIKTVRRLAPARLRTGGAPDAGVLQSKFMPPHLARAATTLPLLFPAAAGEIIPRHTGRGFLAAAATGSRRGERGRHADAGRAADPQPTRSSVVIMPLATRFTELAGCAVPIQQAPMGLVSTPGLAVAVADAGGVGRITAHLDQPVLAAGGIGDGRAFAEVLAAGAAGARAGTRFVATNESGAHPAYKEAVAGATAASTEITGAFSVCPLCATEPRARGLRSCIDALGDLAGDTGGEATGGGGRISLPKGHGLPPGATRSEEHTSE